jgi:hypothetical protein
MMKYLRKFKHFENVDVLATDEPDMMVTKEETNDLEQSIKEYPTVKSELDKAFINLKTDKDNTILKQKIEEIRKKFPNNPFIEEYVRMMSLQIRIKQIQDELIKYNDDLYKNSEDLKLLNSNKADPNTIVAKTKTINDIKSNQTIKTQEIAKAKKDLITAETGLKNKMDNIKKEFQESSKKITDGIKK